MLFAAGFAIVMSETERRDKMLKYPCLVLDHDDTVVQSEATVHYPCFREFLSRIRPGQSITLSQYTHGCYHLGFPTLCRQVYHLTDEEMEQEYQFWKQYTASHMPQLFPGIKALLCSYRAAGGRICVVSHALEKTILRDYQAMLGFSPDAVFGWDLPEAQRKPSPYPLACIMDTFHLAPEQLLVVDDMKPGREMAQVAGCPFAFAGWGKKDCPEIVEEMAALCDHAFAEVAELGHFLFEN